MCLKSGNRKRIWCLRFGNRKRKVSSKVVTGKELCVSEVVTGKELCVSDLVTGKGNNSQVWPDTWLAWPGSQRFLPAGLGIFRAALH